MPPIGVFTEIHEATSGNWPTLNHPPQRAVGLSVGPAGTWTGPFQPMTLPFSLNCPNSLQNWETGQGQPPDTTSLILVSSRVKGGAGRVVQRPRSAPSCLGVLGQVTVLLWASSPF